MKNVIFHGLVLMSQAGNMTGYKKVILWSSGPSGTFHQSFTANTKKQKNICTHKQVQQFTTWPNMSLDWCRTLENPERTNAGTRRTLWRLYQQLDDGKSITSKNVLKHEFETKSAKGAVFITYDWQAHTCSFNIDNGSKIPLQIRGLNFTFLHYYCK